MTVGIHETAALPSGAARKRIRSTCARSIAGQSSPNSRSTLTTCSSRKRTVMLPQDEAPKLNRDRISERLDEIKTKAEALPPGSKERERLERRIRGAATHSHMTDWISPPGLRPPE